MTRAQLTGLARHALEDLPAELQEVALMRAVARKVIAWDACTPDELTRIYAAARAVALVAEVTP